MPLAIQRFFGEPPNWRAFTLFMLVYLLILCWSVIFNDKMAPRVLLACLSYMMVGAVIVWLIWRHGYPDYLPAVLVNSLKAVTSRRLRNEFLDLRGAYSKPVLWSRSYFVGSCGGAP